MAHAPNVAHVSNVAHASNVAHCMIRSAALHLCDYNKVSLLIG